MSNKLTPTELAAKLYALQRALEDRTTASEMLAESEATITRLRDEIGTDHDLIKALFTPDLPLVVRRRRYKTMIRRVSRKVWLAPTLQAVKSVGHPATISEVAKVLKGTDGEALNNSVLGSRLHRLYEQGLLVRKENGRGLQYSVAELSPTAPPPIIARHRGQVDSGKLDPHPWQVANRAAAAQ